MAIEEINHLLEFDGDGILTAEGQEAVKMQIDEWFSTPQGMLWGLPSWGHRLDDYRHRPIGTITAAAMSNAIYTKLPQDIDSVMVTLVEVTPATEDSYLIYIHIPQLSDNYQTQVTM